MLGTGLSASSLSESTIPSTTSSSSTDGTYCRHIGSLGDLIRSTIAGEIRNSKFSAACRRRSSSGKFSGPNRSASASSEWIEFFLRTSCQVSMALPALVRVGARDEELHIDDLIVAWGIEIRNRGGAAVAAGLVERPGRCVVGAAGGLHHHHAGHAGEPPLHLRHQPGADAGPVHGGRDRQPVHVPGA